MKEDQRVRLSRQMLRNALISLLKEKPINKISVREICSTAEINRTTFYKYYGSQYDLLADIENNVLDELSERMKTGRSTQKLLPGILGFIEENAEVCRLLINNNVDPEFPKRVLNMPEIREQLSDVTNDEAFSAHSEYMYEFLVCGGFSIITKWINSDKRESPAELAAFLDRIFNRIGMNV
ncbi:MAG: TetR/AcrR family transcriptional regulator [Oscillospiraceae bacterium]